MLKKIKALLKIFIKIYILIASIVGSATILIPTITLFYNGMFAPAPFRVYIPNGFIYDKDKDTANKHLIKDEDNNVVIIADVKDIMWHEDFIYGYRQGLAKEGYYYICQYRKNCSNQQHFGKEEIQVILEERSLPPYDSEIAKTYHQLLKQQDKTNIGRKGE